MQKKEKERFALEMIWMSKTFHFNTGMGSLEQHGDFPNSSSLSSDSLKKLFCLQFYKR